MGKTLDVLVAWALCLWVGGTLVIGYLVTPVLFAQLGDRRLAGDVAGLLFQRLGWLGLGCAVLILGGLALRRAGPQHAGPLWRTPLLWAVLVMLACAAANLFHIQPTIADLKAAGWPKPEFSGTAGDLFARWHAVSAVVYLAQSFAGLAAVGLWAIGRGGDSRGEPQNQSGQSRRSRTDGQ